MKAQLAALSGKSLLWASHSASESTGLGPFRPILETLEHDVLSLVVLLERRVEDLLLDPLVGLHFAPKGRVQVRARYLRTLGRHLALGEHLLDLAVVIFEQIDGVHVGSSLDCFLQADGALFRIPRASSPFVKRSGCYRLDRYMGAPHVRGAPSDRERRSRSARPPISRSVQPAGAVTHRPQRSPAGM